jgi:hypothetical protein
MNKLLLMSVLLIGFIIFSTAVFASEEMMGTILKIQEPFLIVEDNESGDQVKVHVDDQTEVEGTIKEGSFVRIDIDKGHAVSITVFDVEGEEGDL